MSIFHRITKFQSVILIIAIVIFVVLFSGVMNNTYWVHNLDNTIIAFVRPNFPGWKTAFFTRFTVLFNTVPIILYLVVGTAVLALRQRIRASLFFVFTTAFGNLLNSLVKHFVSRPRPSYHQLMHYTGYSFPSGHSIASVLLLGSLMVLAHYYIRNRSYRLIIYIVFIFLIMLVGYSRIYVGVHYPSDVLAGYALGTIVVVLGDLFFGMERYQI